MTMDVYKMLLLFFWLGDHVSWSADMMGISSRERWHGMKLFCRHPMFGEWDHFCSWWLSENTIKSSWNWATNRFQWKFELEWPQLFNLSPRQNRDHLTIWLSRIGRCTSAPSLWFRYECRPDLDDSAVHGLSLDLLGGPQGALMRPFFHSTNNFPILQ